LRNGERDGFATPPSATALRDSATRCGPVKAVCVRTIFKTGIGSDHKSMAARTPLKLKHIVAAGLIIIGGLLAFGWVASRVIPPVRGFQDCDWNLRFVAHALVDYERAHGALLPAVGDAHAKRPVRSWRVEILSLVPLPYMELAKRYDSREPWDGPHNKALRDEEVMIYHCPSDPGPRKETSYVAVVGAKGWWSADKPAHGPVQADAAHTILVVETVRSGIHWLEPRDMSVQDALRGVNAPEPSISSRHEGFGLPAGPGGHCVFADGRVQWLNNRIDPKVLAHMIEKGSDVGVDKDQK